jgi:hypothetical protein
MIKMQVGTFVYNGVDNRSSKCAKFLRKMAEIVYCFCNSKGEEDEFMIQCDGCGEWYHGKCLNPVVLDSEANFISEYYCTVCEPPYLYFIYIIDLERDC